MKQIRIEEPFPIWVDGGLLIMIYKHRFYIFRYKTFLFQVHLN